MLAPLRSRGCTGTFSLSSTTKPQGAPGSLHNCARAFHLDFGVEQASSAAARVTSSPPSLGLPLLLALALRLPLMRRYLCPRCVACGPVFEDGTVCPSSQRTPSFWISPRGKAQRLPTPRGDIHRAATPDRFLADPLGARAEEVPDCSSCPFRIPYRLERECVSQCVCRVSAGCFVVVPRFFESKVSQCVGYFFPALGRM